MGLSIIMGNMFSGKTSEMIRRLKRLKVIEKKIIVINSAKDTRSPDEVLKSHDNITFECFKAFYLFELINTLIYNTVRVLLIDTRKFSS